jgi:hypothetical protein
VFVLGEGEAVEPRKVEQVVVEQYIREEAWMDHSVSRSWYFFVLLASKWERMMVEGMGVRQHFAGQWVSDSRAVFIRRWKQSLQ